ncbi:hypothetical protein EXD76_01230 [BEV proteobacterium]|nr:hypothetical protein [Candidatus Symbiopectobacterium sp. Chty_BC]
MKPNCMILRCEDSSFHWVASIKSVYSIKPFSRFPRNRIDLSKIHLRHPVSLVSIQTRFTGVCH